ncbi:MAG: ACP S-malonyltransferase [Alphaproteobacteria bacterium]
MNRAFVFPGQASQAVGMGAGLATAFPAARELFEEVDDALSQRLSKLMFEGPEDELTLTENAQPAIVAVSLAVVRVLEREGGIRLAQKGRFVAGHSMGEYSALCATGALSVADAVRLVKRRGQAMQEAVPVGEGAMAALIGLDLDTAREVAEAAAEGEVCTPANDNAPGQVVLSGDRAAVERAVEIAADKGARRAIMLPVSAPFHCSLMAPAADVMAEALAEVVMSPPSLTLIANVTAAPVEDPDSICGLLVQQVTAMVRWRESVLRMKEEGVETLVELGAGKILSGLIRRIDRDLQIANAGTPEEIEALGKIL